MVLAQKKQIVEDLSHIYSNTDNIFVIHYHGLTVSDLSNFRSILKKDGGHLRVVKNKLSKIAALDTKVDIINDMFKGPAAISYGKDAVTIAKIVVNFAKGHSNLKIIGGLVNSKRIDSKEVNILAKTPSLKESQAMIVNILQISASKLANILTVPVRSVVNVLKEYSKK